MIGGTRFERAIHESPLGRAFGRLRDCFCDGKAPAITNPAFVFVPKIAFNDLEMNFVGTFAKPGFAAF